MTVVKIIGGHGRIAMLLAKQLASNSSVTVESLIRNPSQASDIVSVGAKPVVFDIVSATDDQLASQFKGTDIVIWSAGNGGKGGVDMTYKIDRDGAIRVIKSLNGVSRFIMVSAIGMEFASKLPESFGLYHYYQAKHAADSFLKQSGVPYTIIGPGGLSDEPGTGLINASVTPEQADPRQSRPTKISRSNVAQVLATLVTNKKVFDAQLNKYVELLDGNTPIDEALSQ